MTGLIDNIFNITITRTASAPSITGFSGVMVVSEFLASVTSPAFSRVAVYGSLTEITAAGFATTSAVYLAAQAVFAQNPSTNQIYVGRKLTGVDGTETWTEALTAIALENSDWKFFGIDSTTLADQQMAATWAESNSKIVGFASADANFVDGTGDIAESIKTSNYDRSFAIYDPLADRTATDKFIEFAEIGKLIGATVAPNIPGSLQWAYKTLTGPASYVLTTAQYNTATDKNGNIYIPMLGTDNFLFGTVGSGEYIDIIWGVDYLEARLQQDIFALIRGATTKIPYTDAGIQSVVSTVRSVLDEFVAAGFLNPGYEVTYPLRANISQTDLQNRELKDIAFTATLTGAIYKATINGVVSVL